MKALGLVFLSLLAHTTGLYCSLGRVDMMRACSSARQTTIGLSSGVPPSVSSKDDYAWSSRNVKHDVWVVGSGTLGEQVLSILANMGTTQIVAETKSSKRAQSITSLGCEHRLRDQRSSVDEMTAKTVIICMPPSSATNYSAEVQHASRLWSGPDAGGNLIYTSSIGVYGDACGNTVTELSTVDARSASSAK